MKKQTISTLDLYTLEISHDMQISPDGKHILYVLQRIDRKSEKKFNNLWLLPTEGGSAMQFTYGDHSDVSPRWSPDGKQIAFLSNRGDKEKPPQLYVIPFQGGEAHPLSQIPGTIDSFSWSPDGRGFICSITKKDAEELEREKDEQKKKLGVVYRKVERLFYKLDGAGYLPKERTHIWWVNAASGKSKQLTDHPVFAEIEPSFSPDGKWIVFFSNRNPDPDNHIFDIDLFIMPSMGGEFRKISTPPGLKSQPVFSPDGQWIAYYGAENFNKPYKNTCVWIVPTDGSLPPKNLTEKLDLQVGAETINDTGHADTIAPVWSLDGQKIYFQVSHHGNTTLHSISNKGDDFQQVINEQGVVCRFGFDKNQTRLAYFLGTLSDPGQVYLKEFKGKKSRLLSQINRRLLDKKDLGTIEEVWYKGPDGNDLQGWILKPPGFTPDKKYPSILEIHGGPRLQYGNFFMHEFYYLAANGYVVYFTNPRGGQGYGEEHCKAIINHWGEPDYADIIAWNEHAARLPYIDTNRMGITGGSYGGYMTLWVIGHTDRFKAAVAQRVVSNWVSMYGSSDVNWVFEPDFENTPPYIDVHKTWDHSPMAFIKNAKTPTLILHNESDFRTPIEQGEQAFVALKRLGVETEMVRFPDEPHGLSRIGRTDRRISRLSHMVRWFDLHLKG